MKFLTISSKPHKTIHTCILVINNRGKRRKNILTIANIPIDKKPKSRFMLSNYIGVWQIKTK